jgi:hypothetical protein
MNYAICFLMKSTKQKIAVGICRADYATQSILNKLALTSPTSDGRSVGIVPSRNALTVGLVVKKLRLQARRSRVRDPIR